MYVDAVGADTSLAAAPEFADNSSRNGVVDVRVIKHDERRIPTGLERNSDEIMIRKAIAGSKKDVNFFRVDAAIP